MPSQIENNQKLKLPSEKGNLLRKPSGIFKFLNKVKRNSNDGSCKKDRHILNVSESQTSLDCLNINEKPGPFRYIPESKYSETEYPQPLLDILDLNIPFESEQTIFSGRLDVLDEETLYASDDIDSFIRMYEDPIEVNTFDSNIIEESILHMLLPGKVNEIDNFEVPPEALNVEDFNKSIDDNSDISSSFDELISAGRTSTPFEDDISETTAFSTYEVVDNADVHIYKNYSTKKLLYITNNVITPQLNNMLHSNTQIP